MLSTTAPAHAHLHVAHLVRVLVLQRGHVLLQRGHLGLQRGLALRGSLRACARTRVCT